MLLQKQDAKQMQVQVQVQVDHDDMTLANDRIKH